MLVLGSFQCLELLCFNGNFAVVGKFSDFKATSAISSYYHTSDSIEQHQINVENKLLIHELL